MAFLWTTIKVKDLEASLTFYQDIVGLTLNRRFPAGPGTEIAFLGGDGTQVELICDEKVRDIRIGPDISLGFSVPFLEEKLAFLAAQGIKPHSGPFAPNPHTRFFYILDPNGLKIQFVQGG